MTIETQAVELNEDELDNANGGFRLEVDSDPVVSKPKKKKAEHGLISMGIGETCGI